MPNQACSQEMVSALIKSTVITVQSPVPGSRLIRDKFSPYAN